MKPNPNDLSNFDYQYFKDALPYIGHPDQDYNRWDQVGMILKTEGQRLGQEQDFFNLWDSWSQQGRLYTNGETARKWKGFNRSDLTGATFTKWAQEGGFDTKSYFKCRGGYGNYKSPTPQPMVAQPQPQEPDQQEHPRFIKDVKPISLPSGHNLTGREEMAAQISALFGPADLVDIVTKCIKKANGKWDIIETKNHYPAADIVAALKGSAADGTIAKKYLPYYNKEAGAWVRINPMDGKGGSDKNVTAYRHALIEYDKDDLTGEFISLEKQFGIFKALNLPITCVYFSGNKSLHAAVKIQAKSKDEYAARVAYLHDVLTANGWKPDEKNKNCGRLTRLAGVDRGDCRQSFICGEMGPRTFEEWTKWVSTKETAVLQAANDNIPREFLEPITPLEEVVLPEFPLDALPEWLQRYVLEQSTALSVTPDFTACSILEIAAVAVMQAARVKIRDGWIDPLNLYTLIIGDSGAGKTPTRKALGVPMDTYEKAMNEKMADMIVKRNSAREMEFLKQEQIKNSRKEIAKFQVKGQLPKGYPEDTDFEAKLKELDEIDAESKKKTGKGGELEELHAFEYTIMGDSTPEAVNETLDHQDGNISVFDDESDTFLSIINGRYSNGDINAGPFLTGIDGGTIKIKRVGRTIYIKDANVSMLVYGQEKVMKRLTRPDMREIGFLGRFLIAAPEPYTGEEEDQPAVSPVARAQYLAAIWALLCLPKSKEPQDRPLLEPSPEAYKMYIDWAENINLLSRPRMAEMHHMADHTMKSKTRLMRIAAILHLLDLAHDRAQTDYKNGNSHIYGDISYQWRLRQKDDCADDLTITTKDMDRAIKIKNYYLAHAQSIYGKVMNTREITDSKKVIQAIQKRECKVMEKCGSFQDIMTQREISNAISHDDPLRKKENLTPIMELLEAHGFLITEKPEDRKTRKDTPGPYRIRPEIMDYDISDNTKKDR